MKLVHTRLLVADMGASLTFYRDVIGLSPRFGGESAVYEEFNAGGHVLSLFDRKLMDAVTDPQGAPARQGSTVVLCFEVANVDEAFRQIESLGGKAVTLPQDQPAWMIRVAHFRDPDGNLVEISQPLKA
jgi:predicted enzyme related to lactoylglutathione lyase